ncbi:uncharacterized protein LOC144714889 [Wolffia australiana]
MGGGKKNFSAVPSDYQLLEEVGCGASATVYRAIYLPLNEVVAVKCLDLDRCNSNLDDIRREAQTMSLIDHPNVIRAYCSFVVDRCLWVVMPYMTEGSCLHLMKVAHADGFEEPVICSILKETLKALEYLHRHGHIHRDVKAGNILIDSTGAVKLGDFGVSACMFDAGDRQRSRNTFVGTPCWMAPEVLQRDTGYDFKVDIWSFGITALELAHGHAPFSKYPPMKVLLMTIQNAPPGLDYERDKKFSKSFKEMVGMCLVKDQSKRPSAERLLKHSFFKNVKAPEVSLKGMFADLPPLWERVNIIKKKDAAQLALKKMPSAEQEALSQSEYQRGVSAWNFDLEDLKAQAALIPDDEEDGNLRFFPAEKVPSISEKCAEELASKNDRDQRESAVGAAVLENGSISAKGETETHKLGVHSAITEEKSNGTEVGVLKKSAVRPAVRSEIRQNSSMNDRDRQQVHSGPLLTQNVLRHSLSDRGRISDRFDGENISAIDKHKQEARKGQNFSGPLMLPNRASANSLSAPTRSSGGYRDSSDDKSKSNVVQIKGRFSVTSENVDLVKDIPSSAVSRKVSQGSPLRKSASVGDWIAAKALLSTQPAKEVHNVMMPASVMLPHLQNLQQQISFQQELITNLLNSFQLVDSADVGATSRAANADNNLVDLGASEREQMFLSQISELQTRMINLTDELTATKMKQLQLQQQLDAVKSRSEDTSKGEKEANTSTSKAGPS